MTDTVLVALITTFGQMVVGALVVLGGKKTRQRVETVHKLVNEKSDVAASDIAALKGEVGRLNEVTTNTTPQDGGAVNLRHGQVVVSKEPEIQK